MDLAGLARNMVSNGKLRSSRDHTPITKPYRPPPKYIVRMKPVDYIGLYLIVIASSLATVNILYRIYY